MDRLHRGVHGDRGAPRSPAGHIGAVRSPLLLSPAARRALDAQSVLRLQRSAGNAAVAAPLSDAPSVAGTQSGLHVERLLGPDPAGDTGLPGSIAAESDCACGTAGRRSVQRRVSVDARKDEATGIDPVDPPKAMRTAATATPENLQLAQMIDELDKLSDDKLYKRRDEAVVGATKDGGEDQERHIRTLQAIEFLASRRGLDALKPNWDRISRTKPIPRRLNVRALLEAAVREKGSFKKAVEAFPDKGDAAADYRFFEAEAERFKRQFRGQARVTADRMLEESLQAIAKLLTSYGIPPSSARSAARELAAGTGELDDLAEAVIASAKRSGDVDAPAKEKNRESLAITVENLKKQQATIRRLKKQDEELFEDWRKDKAKFDQALADHARTVDKSLETSRNALRGAWIKAERTHPVLASYRSDADLENIDLGTLDTDPVDRQMKSVVAQLLPKMVDIGKARGMLKNDVDFAVKLPSVIALTRTNMFIPEGSLRAGMVNDLAAEAKGDDSLVRAAALAMALLTLIPTGGASLAIPLGMASAGIAIYSVTKEWEKYKTVRTLSNTGLDLARSISTEEPSLTGFAVSLVELGLEGLPLIGAFKKARQVKRLADAGEDTAQVVKDLNRIGSAHHAPDLGERALIEARKDARKAAAGGAGQTAERGAAKAVKVADDAPVRNLTNAQLADADVVFKMGDYEHTIGAWKIGGRIQINLCSTCGSMIEKIDAVLAQISAKGPTKSLHRRLTKLRAKVERLEKDIASGKVKFNDLPREANQLASHMRDLSSKFPNRFDDELKIGKIDYPDISDYVELADRLGYTRIAFRSHGQPVFQRGGFYISPDVDSHIGGVWKGATSPRGLLTKATRSGTYDADLNRIGA
jgi:hypothetical protein